MIPSGKAKPLFVAGCQRSGTTAFAEYLNQHPKILVGVERYGRVPAKTITPELFTFERILDYKEETIRPREYYVELLSKKEPEKLEWIGDKNPNYVLHLEVLSRNNPGAHFIVLYRPVEEVAESWEVASSNPNDPWRGRENGFERGVHIWNRALRKTREFIENGTNPKVLIVSYHDFFNCNETCIPLISRFLGLRFDESIGKIWKEMSAQFEKEQRPKERLSGERAEFIQENKDHAAEEWVLSRIDEQWDALEREAEETEKVVHFLSGNPHKLAAALVRARVEAEDQATRARRLEQQVGELKSSLADKARMAEKLEQRNERLTLRIRDLRRQIRNLQRHS